MTQFRITSETLRISLYMVTGFSDLSGNQELKSDIHIYYPVTSSNVLSLSATLQTLRTNTK